MLQVSKEKWVVVGNVSRKVKAEGHCHFISVAGHLPWIRRIFESESQWINTIFDYFF